MTTSVSTNSVSNNRPSNSVSATSQRPSTTVQSQTTTQVQSQAPVAKTESVTMSREARQAIAYDKSNQAWTKLNQGFDSLPEADKVDLGKQIGTKIKELTKGQDLNPAQLEELKWSAQASVSADWAANKASNPDSAKMGSHYMSAVGNLYYGGMDYMKNRNEYLANGGQIGQ